MIKKQLLMVLLCTITFLGYSQGAPDLINYQSVIRDASNNVIANSTISVKFEIKEINPIDNNPIWYSETHSSVPTNGYGMFNLKIGSGDLTAGFNALPDAFDWASSKYSLVVSVDTAAGSNYTVMGESQLVSVPYALHARTAGSVKNPHWNRVIVNSEAKLTAAYPKVGIGNSNPLASLDIVDNSLSDTTKEGVKIALKNTVGGTQYNDGLSVVLNSTTTGGSNAIYSESNGVNTGKNIGVWGVSSGSTTDNRGIEGTAVGTSGANYGVIGSANGVTSGSNRGLVGDGARSTTENMGLFATAYYPSTTATNYGVYGAAQGGLKNYAGYFLGDVTVTGNLNVTGTIAKGGGTFKIDHPEDPANKYLVHSFVESPEMMNVYNGNTKTDANGFSTVELPSYFDKANKECRYQLTVIGTFAQAIVKKKVSGNSFVIQTNQPNVEVSWQVTGIRADKWANKNRVVPELDKKEKGTYIHPELYNQPKEKREGYRDVTLERTTVNSNRK